MKHIVVAVIASVLSATCAKDPPAPPPPAVVVTADAGACERACTVLQQFGCPEAQTPDGGLPCVTVCTDAEDSGTFSLNAGCVARALTVDQVRACGTVRCRQ